MPIRKIRQHRRRVVAIAAITTAALVAGGCSGGDDSEATGATAAQDTAPVAACPVDALPTDGEPVEITVWHPFSGVTATVLEDMAAEYNDSQDRVRVSVEAQGSSPELHKKYSDALGSGDGLPDLTFSEDVNLQFLVDSGSVVPASSCMDADDDPPALLEDLFDPVRSAYTVDDRLWPAGFGVATLMMYANDAHLRAAGIESGTMPETLDELRSMAEQVRDANIPGVSEPVAMKLDPWVLETVLTGAEQEMVNEDNGRAGLASASTLDGDATTEFLDWLAGMTADGLLKAVPYGDSLDDFMAIANGSSTFTISGTRSISSVAAVMDGQNSGLSGSNAEAEAALARLDLRAGLFPGLDAPGRSGVSGTAAYVVDGPDEQVAATWDFVKYFSQTPQQVRWAIDGSYLPVSEEVLTDPALVEAATTTRSGEWTATVMAGLSELDADFPGPLIGPYAENREVLIGLLEAVAGGEPIDRQVDDATARITGYLEDYRAEVGG